MVQPDWASSASPIRVLAREPSASVRAQSAVERLQPGEEVVVLRAGKVARQRLVEMVVRVDEARQDDLAAEVDHRIGGCRQLLGRSDLLDDAVLGIEAGVASVPGARRPW